MDIFLIFSGFYLKAYSLAILYNFSASIGKYEMNNYVMIFYDFPITFFYFFFRKWLKPKFVFLWFKVLFYFMIFGDLFMISDQFIIIFF
jgi:hypothetical protein